MSRIESAIEENKLDEINLIWKLDFILIYNG